MVRWGDEVNNTRVPWITRFKEGPWAPIWLGLSIAIGYLVTRCLFDGFFLLTWGFPPGTSSWWQSDVWWPELVNATLFGYVPAVLMIASRGINRDLSQLRPWLPSADAVVDEIRNAATGPDVLAVRALKLVGLVIAALAVFTEPTLSRGAEQSMTNPGFLWPLLRTIAYAWFILSLVISDLKATRTYFNMGRNSIEVDLLDVQSLSPFAQRGLRSALTWIIFSIIFSLFWLGEQASRGNPGLLMIALAMATGAFLVPLIGVRESIISTKRSELERLREEIRVERSIVLNNPPDDKPASPRLANLIAYHQLIDRTQEWPINAASLLRFFMYILIGLGSWLGGALIERLLDSTLGT
ncbi:MAG TPA: hypothetical protein EYQ14_25620 [Gammaproteobacteria bacterium]|nr:hypothetical protein [Gammaproteobacteria bacterium]